MATAGAAQEAKSQRTGRGSGADAAEKRSAAGPTEGAVVGGGGEEEPGGRAGAGIGSGETEALAVGEVGLAVETLSHVKSGGGLAGGVDERSRGGLLVFPFPLVFVSLATRGGRVDSAWHPPEQRANRGGRRSLSLAWTANPPFKRKSAKKLI
jgi:hypothetical protein